MFSSKTVWNFQIKSQTAVISTRLLVMKSDWKSGEFLVKKVGKVISVRKANLGEFLIE